MAYLGPVPTLSSHIEQGRNQDFNLAKQKYKILTSRKNRCLETLLINHKRHSGTAKKLLCFGYFNTKSVSNFVKLNFSTFSLRVEKIIMIETLLRHC